MQRSVIVSCLSVALLAIATPAAADITAFIGITPTPDTRFVRGLSFGFGLLIIGVQSEYANAVEDEVEGLPSLRTASGNILFQTPGEIGGVQLYGTTGGGVYRERLLSRQETDFGSNIGGGAK